MSGQELEQPQRSPMQQVVTAVRSEQFMGQIANALPGNVTPERFVRCAVTAIQQTPELIVADRDSLFQSIIKCAQAGLLPDGREAALVEVKIKGEKKVQFWPMVGGYRKIAAKHGITIVSDVVREGDHFDWQKVPPKIEHRPALGDLRGDIVCFYAASFDRDWRFVTAPTVMDIPEVEKIRAVSRASNSEYGPWVNWYDRMGCKTVTRRQFSELPLPDLDERAAKIRDAGDDEANLPALETGMTIDEANVSASLAAAVPTDGGPIDVIDDAELVDETEDGEQGEFSFEERAAQAQRERAAKGIR